MTAQDRVIRILVRAIIFMVTYRTYPNITTSDKQTLLQYMKDTEE